jgi:hypothetical protein
VFAAVLAGVLPIGAVASWDPSRHAGQADPIELLESEKDRGSS